MAFLTGAVAQANVWQELVDADRRLAVEAAKGDLSAAFLSALAEDSIAFGPGPVPARPFWADRKAAHERLEWAPAFAEVSISGDLGYVIAPWRYTRLDNADDPENKKVRDGKPDDGQENDPTPTQPSAHGHLLNVWQRNTGGEWRLLLSHSIAHAPTGLASEPVRRGSLFAGEAPVWPVGLPELRKADLEPAGSIKPELVAADFLRMRDGRLPDGLIRAEPFDQGAPRRLRAGLVISGAGDLALTWGGAANAVRWVRIWRRPAAGDPPGLGWRLAVDLSQAAQKTPESQ